MSTKVAHFQPKLPIFSIYLKTQSFFKQINEADKLFCQNRVAMYKNYNYYYYQKALPYVDILFGNEDEARSFAKEFGLNTQDVAQIAQKVKLRFCSYPFMTEMITFKKYQ